MIDVILRYKVDYYILIKGNCMKEVIEQAKLYKLMFNYHNMPFDDLFSELLLKNKDTDQRSYELLILLKRRLDDERWAIECTRRTIESEREKNKVLRAKLQAFTQKIPDKKT